MIVRWLLVLLLVLFLTGTQSACFSPLKYAILPQHLSAEALTGGNGQIGVLQDVERGPVAPYIGLVQLLGGDRWRCR